VNIFKTHQMNTIIEAPSETKRLATLRQYDIVDSNPEQEYDDIVMLASSICDVPIATITFIEEQRQWYKAYIGPSSITQIVQRKLSFCAHTIERDDVMVVNDATKDERFWNHPNVVNAPYIRFYTGVPLINPEGYKLGTLCVLDQTPRELSDIQLESLKVLSKQVVKQMELRRQKKELERMNEFHHKILAIIGHDLRVPLNSLGSLLELREKYNLSLEEFSNQIPNVLHEVNSTKELLNNLLEWATSQFSENEIKRQPISLIDAMSMIQESSALLAQQKGNKIISNFSDNCVVMGDASIIRTILRNLILNANKFTENGTITVSAQRVDDKVEISVEDTGVGIEKERLEKMFSWNGRNSTRGTKGEKGAGLGLLVCKDFVERSGGTLRVVSKVGKGTKCYFSLPQFAISDVNIIPKLQA